MRKREQAEVHNALFYQVRYILDVIQEPEEVTEYTIMDILLDNRLRPVDVAELQKQVRYFIANRNIR
jgi:hypothetical protein